MKKRRTLAIIIIMAVLICQTLVTPAFARSFDKVVYANADPLMYRVEVDLTNKIVTIYERDDAGKYTRIANQFICTTGTNDNKTPTGSFSLNDMRRRFGYFSQFKCYAQYWINVKGGIYFHSILYSRPEEGRFTTTSFNALGKQASHGCIRMLVEDVRWMYYNLPAGTKGVITYKEENEALRKSLLPTFTAKQYKPEPDEYENEKRGAPTAVLAKDAQFKSVSGQKYSLEKGDVVTVMSSGTITCRVRDDGVEGHVSTSALSFIPNGPASTQLVYYINNADAHYYRQASVYNEPDQAAELGQKLNVTGKTKSFYRVETQDETYYVLKEDVNVTTEAKYASEVEALHAQSIPDEPMLISEDTDTHGQGTGEPEDLDAPFEEPVGPSNAEDGDGELMEEL